MSSVLPPAHEHHGGHWAYKLEPLASTGYVHVSRDAPHGPLQRPYDGPFKVLEVHDKYYVLDVNGCQASVSIDRLKMAFGKQADRQLTPATPPDSLFTPTQSCTVSANNSCTSAYCVYSLGKTDQKAHPLPLTRPCSSRCPSLGGPLWRTSPKIKLTVTWVW